MIKFDGAVAEPHNPHTPHKNHVEQRLCNPGMVYRVLGQKRNHDLEKEPETLFLCIVSHEIHIFMVLLLKEGPLCLVCVFPQKAETQDTQDLPKRVPFQHKFFTKSGHLWPPRTPIQPNTSFTLFG